MKRPFDNKRPIGPFSDIIRDSLGLISPGGEADEITQARINITEAYNNTPQWAKSADTCVDWIKKNLIDEIAEVSTKTSTTGDEHTFAVCHDGNTTTISQTVSGGHDVAPSVSCAGAGWKLIDVHTHPKDSPIYPSVTDLRTIVFSENVPIPHTLNEVIIREDRRASCLNVFDIEARLDVVDLYTTIDSGDFSRRESAKMARDLVQKHGSEFNMRRI